VWTEEDFQDEGQGSPVEQWESGLGFLRLWELSHFKCINLFGFCDRAFVLSFCGLSPVCASAVHLHANSETLKASPASEGV
jgi:hypothetical protein